jgi:hypothetical protein
VYWIRKSLLKAVLWISILLTRIWSAFSPFSSQKNFFFKLRWQKSHIFSIKNCTKIIYRPPQRTYRFLKMSIAHPDRKKLKLKFLQFCLHVCDPHSVCSEGSATQNNVDPGRSGSAPLV